MKKILVLENVSKIYTMDEGIEVKALDDINISIEENEFASILGPSGSGKSTLLHIIGLLDSPTSGKRYIDGIETSTMNDASQAKVRGEKIGFVFQTFNLIPSLSARENVELPMLVLGVDAQKRKERATKLLSQLGLGDRLDHLPGQLSGGQRQRVAIARALVNDPQILLADEPTGNLDSKTGKEVLEIFKTLHKEGRTILIITHDEYIAKVTHKVIRIKDGKISEK